MEPDCTVPERPLQQSSVEEAFATTKVSKPPETTTEAACEPASLIPHKPSESSTNSGVVCSSNDDSLCTSTTEPIALLRKSREPQENKQNSLALEASGSVSQRGPDNIPETPMWMGEALTILKTPSFRLPSLICEPGHRIFFTCSGGVFDPRVPYPSSYTDNWSEQYVRMPCSPENLYSVVKKRRRSLFMRWNLIENKLRESITTSQKLQEAILSYNERFKSVWNFNVLHDLLENHLPEGDTESFFNGTLPAMCDLALNLPVYLTQPIPLMRNGCEMSFTFSQLQIASLLANAFFCTFPRRYSRTRNAKFTRFPSINFSSLFSGSQNRSPISDSRKREKLRCILHYFHRVTQKMPTGTITYTRRCLGNLARNWAESTKSFDQLRIHINSESTIEEAGLNTIQVDFANKFLGGGVLRSGCVQEEILFVLRPELLATCLFSECLKDDEAVLIEGAETYSRSSGYADTFRWTGDYDETQTDMERDEWGRWKTTVVALDATNFRFSPRTQFTPAKIQRELNKAYCGFTDELAPGRKLPSVVATGNWGCGAFRGNVDLKALLQMMACLEAGKSLAYFTFGDKALMTRLHEMYLFLSSNSVTVGRLWDVLTTLDNDVQAHPGGLYEHIKRRLLCSESN